jgi:hypothetical protein
LIGSVKRKNLVGRASKGTRVGTSKNPSSVDCSKRYVKPQFGKHGYVRFYPSNLELERAPGNFRLEKGVSKLEKTSVVNFSQIVTVDKTFIREYVCTLPKSFSLHIDQSLKIVFGIQ